MLEFVIPVTRDDLLCHSISSYSVNELISLRNLPSSVQGNVGLLRLRVVKSVLQVVKSILFARVTELF